LIKRHDDLSLSYVESIPGSKSGELPLVITLHGRGADANDLADLAPAMDGSGYRFVFPNAPTRWEFMPGYAQGYTWFDGWPPEPGSIETSRELLVRFIGELRDRYSTPWNGIVLTGFSQGAMMSLDAAWRLPEKIGGVVAMSGGLYEDGIPDFAARPDIPLLIVHGAEDEVIPVNAARRARMVIEAAGVNVEYHEFPMGHWVTPESIKVVGDFVKKILG
jgi:phospholipase/carboxylesterase